MAKIKNKHVYGTPERIKEIKEECDYIGRNVSRIVEPGHLVIFAFPPKKRSRPKPEEEEKGKTARAARRGNGYDRYKEMG